MQEHYVNVICPQRTKSPMRQKNFPEELRDSQLSPIDIAHTVLEMLENPGPTGTIFEVKEL
jgi:hypothetical protein